MADAIPVGGKKVRVEKVAELQSGAEYVSTERENVGDAADFAKGDEAGTEIVAAIEVKKGDEIVLFTHNAVRVDH
jgi:hypothetical protein